MNAGTRNEQTIGFEMAFLTKVRHFQESNRIYLLMGYILRCKDKGNFSLWKVVWYSFFQKTIERKM